MSVISSQSATTTASRSSSVSSSGSFPCCSVRVSPEELATNQNNPTEKPHKSWIKCSCLRNSLGLNLSRVELGNTGKYSLTNRNKLIENSDKLLSFLKRAQQTLITTKNPDKKHDLIIWSMSFLALNQNILESRGQSKDFYCVGLLEFISQQTVTTVEDINSDVNLESAL